MFDIFGPRPGLCCLITNQYIPLKGMHVSAKLHDLLSEVCITHTFHNTESEPIEAVYTFPLPVDAVLLSFSVMLGDKHLFGVVQEKKQAEDNYENAICEGDAAILLLQLEVGLYSVNVGNLSGDETAIITFCYTQLHHWTNDVLRWHVPTVLAPRYGQSNIEPHQLPDINLSIENVYTLSISVHGLLRSAIIESPSHMIETQSRNEVTLVHLSEGRSFLDRDLILNLRLANDKASAICDHDVEGYVALASFYPILEQHRLKNKKPRLIKLLVDCSGSMAGDSIGQARVALLNILDTLNEQDQFSLVRFGSTVIHEIPKPIYATKNNVIKSRTLVAKMEADLGKTEIFIALEQTINASNSNELISDVLLITDGEVWDDTGIKTQDIINLATQNQHRIFTVGVGNSVSERLVRELAEGTQGACELINPGEGMAEKIERHFNRIYLEQAKRITVQWPTKPLWQTQPKHFFIGDTLHIFASFLKKPQGLVKLVIDFTDNFCLEQSVKITSTEANDDISNLARLIANQQLQILTDNDEKVALAVKYQLICNETAYLVIDVKPQDLKTNGMPDLRKVPHMLASGWGGVGNSNFDYCDDIDELDESDLVRFGPQIVESDDWIDLPFLDEPSYNQWVLILSNGSNIHQNGPMQFKHAHEISGFKLVWHSYVFDILAKISHELLIYILDIYSLDDPADHISDKDLANLNFPFLQILNINQCSRITDYGLTSLLKFEQLHQLYLAQCPLITDKGLMELAKITQLQTLVLKGCHNITDAGLLALKNSACLTELIVLDCNQISNSYLSKISLNSTENTRLNEYLK